MKIKIFLADDQYLMLEGIKAILKHEPEIEIVGTAQDGHSAVTQVIKLQPDLVLIDIEMPKMNGIMATKYICKHVPDTKVIVLTSHKQQSYIAEAIQAGASGYLSKDSLIQDLKQTIHSLGTDYARAEGKLLTQTIERKQTVNIVPPKKSLYLQRYRKSIYQPALKKQRLQIKQNSSKILVRNLANGISKASLAPIFDFDSPTTQEIMLLDRTKSQNCRLYRQPKFNRQRYLQRIILMLIAIASFVVSVIVF